MTSISVGTYQKLKFFAQKSQFLNNNKHFCRKNYALMLILLWFVKLDENNKVSVGIFKDDILRP